MQHATASAPARPLANANPDEMMIAGLRVYRISVGGQTRWAVQSLESLEHEAKTGQRRSIGDSLHSTPEAAIKEARRIRYQQACNAATRAAWAMEAQAQAEAERQAERQAEAERAAKEAAERADDVNGFTADKPPRDAARIKRVLSRKFRFSNGQVLSRRQRVEALHREGTLVVDTYEEPRIKPMSRLAFFRAEAHEQDAHERRMKEAGNKTVYIVNHSDLGKIAYDYARFLLEQAAGAAS